MGSPAASLGSHSEPVPWKPLADRDAQWRWACPECGTNLIGGEYPDGECTPPRAALAGAEEKR